MNYLNSIIKRATVIAVAVGLFSALIPGPTSADPLNTSTGSAERDLQLLNRELSPEKTYSSTSIGWNVKKQQDKCLQDEAQIHEIEGTILDEWRSAWIAQDTAKFALLVTPSFSVSGFAPENASDVPRHDGIRLRKWAVSEKSGKNGGVRAIEPYLGPWQKIDDVYLVAVDYDVAEKWRSTETLDFSKADLKIRFDIRGLSAQGKRQNDRGVFAVRVERGSKNEPWKLSSIRVQSAETALLDREPAFIERTKVAGLDQVPVELRSEAIRRGGFAISVSDINGDGKPDLYVGAHGKGTVWYGDGNGHFSRQQGHPLESEASVKTAIFADFRNSGKNDAFMTKFVFGENLTDLVYYKNSGSGQLKKEESFVKGKYNYNFAMPATAGDFNKDGYLDLYVGFPGERDFTHLDRDKDVDKKYPQGLFLNAGKGAQSGMPFFLDASDAYWSKWTNMSVLGNIYPHSALAIDYDRDGSTDLLVVDDRMNISPIYRNVDGKRFEAVQDQVNLLNRGFGMGIAAGDLDGDGLTDIVITNVNFAASLRSAKTCEKHWKSYRNAGDPDGVRFFKGQPDGKFIDVTSIAGLDWAGEGMAGVEFIDYDNDGLLDIYVANGLWSGSERAGKQDLSSLFARGVRANRAKTKEVEDSNDYRKSAYLNILRNFKGDLSGKKTASARPSMAGWQRNRLFHNDGNGHFTEVGYLEGVDSIADGYVIAKGDLNQDGRMDLVLRNGDPGTNDYHFPAVQYFENVYPNKNSLMLVLAGTKSNRNGIGALVKVESSGKTQYGQLTANNGSAQSELLVHFGLGTAASADKLEIKWPSGLVQTFKDLKAGRYHIEEGAQPMQSPKIDVAKSGAESSLSQR